MRRMKCRVLGSLGLLPLMCLTGALADEWPQFRGPEGNGRADSSCPLHWDTEQAVRWKMEVPGEGWSCPIVCGSRLFLTTAIRLDETGGEQESGPEPYEGGGGRQRSDLLNATYRWDLLCLDTKSGDLLWEQTVRTGQPPLPRHSSNTYATETPVTDGQRVYAMFGMTAVACYDFEGRLEWRRDLNAYEMRAGWGTSSSPVLAGDLLVLQVDNEEQSYLVALDKRTGDEVWRVSRDEPSQYSTPILWQNSLRTELIVGGQTYRSYDPQTGELLWSLAMDRGRSSATPIAAGDRLYVGTELRNRGGSDDGGGYLVALRPGGSGSLSVNDQPSETGSMVWKLPRSGIQMASPVICEGRLYLLDRRSGVVHCVDAETGERVYRTRIPGARAFWASPWTSAGRVYCLDDSGTTHVLASGPELQVLASNPLGEQTWSSPAVADGVLYLRTVKHLYAIQASEP